MCGLLEMAYGRIKFNVKKIMTKKELIKALEPFPNDMEIFIDGGNSPFGYGYLNEVSKKEIPMTEELGGEEEYRMEVIILTDA